MPNVFLILKNGNGEFVSIKKGGESTIYQTGGAFIHLLGELKPGPLSGMKPAMSAVRPFEPTVFSIDGFIMDSTAISEDQKREFIALIDAELKLFDTLTVAVQSATPVNPLNPFGAPGADGVVRHVPFPFIIYIDP